jgi:hypothetical protein
MRIPKSVRHYLAKLAQRGGEVTGPCKLRGGDTPEERAVHYARLARLSAKARREKAI